MKLLIIICFFFVVFSYNPDFTINVLNDFHINPFFDPTISIKKKCSKPFLLKYLSEPSQSTNHSSYGVLGCNPPYKLLNLMLHQMKKSEISAPDLIFLPGDFVAHGFSQDIAGNFSAMKYEILKEVLKKTFYQVSQSYPDAFLLPAIGNNDVKFHYQVPTLQDKKEYYELLFETWFENNPKNSLLANIDEIKKDFMNGGYYKADISENFSAIVLNTLYFNVDNNANNDQDAIEEQLLWFERQLETIKEKNAKTIISYHIFSGINYYNGIDIFLNKTSNQRIQNLFYKFKDNIILIIGSHIHINGFRLGTFRLNNTDNDSEILETKEEFYGNTIISGAVSPVYYNNPSFLRVNFENFSPKNAKYTYFNLKDFLNVSSIQNDEADFEEIEKFFFEYDMKETYNLEDLTPLSFKKLVQYFDENEETFRKFLIFTYGYPDTEENRAKIFSEYSKDGLFIDDKLTFDEKEKAKYLCTLSESTEEGFNKCLGL